MEVEFANDDLESLAFNSDFTMGLPPHVAQKFRDRVAYIISAPDERTLYAMQGSLDYKKLKGGGDDERQMRLNKQYRIRLQVREGVSGKTLRITGVGDFHD